MQARLLPAISIAAALVLSACSGGGSSHSALPAMNAANGASTQTASSARFVVSVPRTSTQNAARRGAAVSPAVQSLAISAAGATTVSTTVNVAAGSPNCTSTAAALTCSGTVSLLSGNYTFDVKEYDAPNGTGNLLGTGSLAKTIAPGQTTNVAVTLNGIVSTIGVGLSTTTIASGAAATATVTVMAYDPSGNVILGPGSYIDAQGNPVTIALALTDAASLTSLSAKTVTAPSNAAVTLTYAGAAATGGTQVSLSASAGTLTAAPVVLTFTAAGSVPGSLYALDNGVIDQFTADGASLVASYNSPQNINSIGYDGSGNVYLVSAAAIEEYPASSTARVNPIRRLAGSNVIIGYGSPVVAADGTIYVHDSQSIYVYGPTANGNAAPDRTMRASLAHGYSNITGIAIASTGAIYAEIYSYYTYNDAGPYYNREVISFPPGASGSVVPSTRVDVGGYAYGGLGIDAADNLYLLDPNYRRVDVIAANTPSGSFPAPPSFTDGSSPYRSMVVEQSGAVDVSTGSAILHFAAGSSGTVTATTTPASAASFGAVNQLALDYAGNVNVLDDSATSTNGIYTFSAAGIAAGGATVTREIPAYPYAANGLGMLSVAPNGDIVAPGNGLMEALIFAPGSLSGRVPTRAIVNTTSAIENINGAFEDKAGSLYLLPVGSGNGSGGIGGFSAKRKTVAAKRTAQSCCSRGNVIFVYGPGANGNVAPNRTIVVNGSMNVGTVGADGTIYTASGNGILEYAPGSSTATSVALPASANAQALAVDANGQLYVYDGATNAVLLVPKGAASSTATFALPAAAYQQLSTDANNLYVGVASGVQAYALGQFTGASVTGTIAPAGAVTIIPIADPQFGGNDSITAFAFGK